MRHALFAAALPAAFQWNPALIALYRRLVGNGKIHKVALVACARKLLIYANTVVARSTPWIDKPSQLNSCYAATKAAFPWPTFAPPSTPDGRDGGAGAC